MEDDKASAIKQLMDSYATTDGEILRMKQRKFNDLYRWNLLSLDEYRAWTYYEINRYRKQFGLDPITTGEQKHIPSAG